MGSRTETTCRLEDPSKSTGQWYRSSQPGSPDLTAKRAAEPSQPSGCLAETSSQVAEACQQILRLPLSIMYVVPSSSICKNMERPTEYWGPRCHASLADKFSDNPDNLENAQRPAQKLIYVVIRAVTARLPTFLSLALVALGLCSEVSSCLVVGKS
jgi:hypothetical protein